MIPSRMRLVKKPDGYVPKEGDWVKLVNKRPSGWNSMGEMDRYLDRVVHIKHVVGNNQFCIVEDKGYERGRREYWYFRDPDITHICTPELFDKTAPADES